MKWRLTGSFLFSVVIVVILVVFINIVTLLGLFVSQALFKDNQFNNRINSVETMTRGFQQYIVTDNDQVSITDKGKEKLIHHDSWIQILDGNGKQIYGYRLPKGAKEKYTPLDIIQMYKYKEFNGHTTVFIGEKKTKDSYFSYFIGYEKPNVGRHVLTYDTLEVAHLFKIGSLLLIIIDGLIAICIGYIFSKGLTKPLYALIDGIKRLANKNYNIHYEPKGVYKDVFYNVNLLSQELRANENERKKLDQMKEEWIGNISHDIKTPLASIQGYAEMMKDKDYDFSIDEMRDYAEIIERKSIYLKDVIEDLNLSTRLKNKEMTLHKKNVNMVSLVRNTVIDTLNDSHYTNRNIEFQCSDEIIKLEVDEILIRRVVSNLIYNAIVHNDEAVIIQVDVEKNDHHTLIRVKDNGKGIKQEELDRIFDRYFRGTNTGELHKGSGLGMAIAHDIVVAHGGKIQVHSQLGQGTRIEIEL